jgi:hypothetical protein
MNWAELSTATYAALFRDRAHFAQASYRDGEWYCMLGHKGENCNGERYDPALGELLRRSLLEPVGQWCVFWFPHPTKGVRIREKALLWLATHEPQVSWIPDRPVGMASIQGLARPIFQAMRTRRIILVGPQHLARLELFDFQHVIVPDATAWREIDRITAEVRSRIRRDDLVLFASGMATNVMIHRLWPDFRGRATLYDIGAALDPYVGVFSRGEYQAEHWQRDIMPRNLP